MKRILLLSLALGLAGCEGPVGPEGPQGDRGLRGPSASIELALIERTLRDNEYSEEDQSYYVTSPRIQPETVLEVYVKRHFSNTGEAYYTPFDQEVVIERYSQWVTYQVLEGQIRFFDPDKELTNETVAIAVLEP